MKKGICFDSVPGDTVEARLKLAKDAGLDGVEVRFDANMARNRRLRKLAAKIGVELHSIIGGTYGAPPLSSPKRSDREAGIRAVRKGLEQARIIGASHILLVPGRVTKEVTYEQCYKRTLSCVKRLARYAEKAKIPILIENVWNKFLLSPMEFRDYIDKVGSEYVQAYFDVGNILIYGYPQHWIRSLGKRIKKVHVKDFDVAKRDFRLLLQGDVDWAAVRKALRAVGFNDYITAELSGYRSYPDQMLFDTSAALDRIISGK